MSIETMEDLLVHELRDLYNAEQQLLRALPKMVEAATTPELVQALQNHLNQTEAQVNRLEECFSTLGVSSKGKKCAGMEGLLEEADDLIGEVEDEVLRDAAIIGAAQRVEHYEISAYGTARAFAKELGQDEVVGLLTTTIEEEAAADEVLSAIAEGRVNMEADEAGDPEDEEGDARSTSRSSAKSAKKRSSRSSRSKASAGE
jgi:ferritin-like metal-binding protein YciE